MTNVGSSISVFKWCVSICNWAPYNRRISWGNGSITWLPAQKTSSIKKSCEIYINKKRIAISSQLWPELIYTSDRAGERQSSDWNHQVLLMHWDYRSQETFSWMPSRLEIQQNKTPPLDSIWLAGAGNIWLGMDRYRFRSRPFCTNWDRGQKAGKYIWGVIKPAKL